MGQMQARAHRETMPALRPAAAIDIAYRRRLDALIAEMQKSLEHWIEAAYNAKPPEMAQDDVRTKYEGSPSMVMQRVMRSLSRRWTKRFNEAAPKLAEYFSTEIAKRNDRALAAALKKSGFSVNFKMTAQMNDVMRASMNEQVSLIESIAQQHLTEVEGLVMRSVAKGGDLAELSKELRERFGITRRRAALIARDQNSKATAVLERVRQQELGITTAIWNHSHAGKTPRPTHVAMDGKEYEVKKGMWDPAADKFIWPGTEINCRCFARAVLPKVQLKAAA